MEFKKSVRISNYTPVSNNYLLNGELFNENKYVNSSQDEKA